ncbi:YjbF family lipoprotein [Aliiroseovarius crassostreae]|uniref:YjbF family lipoprotein n=1 Tax=Aliiroseovarius crassostreae TaxID=154981 RepID=UPI003C7B69A3
MTYKRERAFRGGFVAAAICAGLVLSGCGNDKSETELPKLWGSLIKDIGSGVAEKVGARKGGKSGSATGAPADPNAAVTASLAATSGPIALIVNEKTKGVSAMTPIQTNGDYVTWQAANKQSLVLRKGVLTSTRGLGEDLMASKPGRATSAILGKQKAAYRRSYFHLSGLAETTELVVDCKVKPLQEDTVSVGEINEVATVMSETCRHSGSSLRIKNLYWVGKGGRILKSRQWVNSPVGYLVVQPLR